MFKIPFVLLLCATFVLNFMSHVVKTETNVVAKSIAREKCLDWQYHASQFKTNRKEICKKLKEDFKPTVAEAKEFPHQAIIGYKIDPNEIQSFCGGSLISDQWVLTAAQCYKLYISNQNTSVVKFGALNLNPNVDDLAYDVIEFIVHPLYRPPLFYNDIALIKLDRKVKFTEYVFPACLDYEGIEPEKALIIGFNFTGADSSNTSGLSLKKGVVSRFDIKELIKIFRPTRRLHLGLNNDTQLFYGSKIANYESCWATSGYAIQTVDEESACTHKLFGIESYGKPCHNKIDPEGLIRINYYLKWIESIVWPGNNTLSFF